MPAITIPIWKEAPFLRIITPFVAGIMLQWNVALPEFVYWFLLSVCAGWIFLFAYFKSSMQFRHYWSAGATINLLLVSSGGIITCYKNIGHPVMPANDLKSQTVVLATLDEPLAEKNKSFKAVASLTYAGGDGAAHNGDEKIIVYFQKDPALKKISFGSGIAFNKPLQQISSTGNPGSFDYKRYCAFQRIYHQVYLKQGEYIVMPNTEAATFGNFLFNIREKTIGILRKYIAGKKEAGLAEALLIGYKNDLDKSLLQSYSKTGVVHVIAISGLHLGLIYWILNSMFRPLGKKPKMHVIRAVLVICGLWLFALIAGAAPSIMRSAVMFSFIALGGRKKISVYNSLAISAFVLLCYNPFWLWDAGFQLSYVAVLSMVIFMRPTYNWFYLKNKLLDLSWKLLATTIAAQVLTTPLIIFYFHQFPNYFLLTNLVAIPLSSLIILGEIVLCMASIIPVLGQLTGAAVDWLIRILNSFIEHMSSMPFVTTDHLQLSAFQLITAYIIIAASAFWLLQKNSKAFIMALCFAGCFISLNTISDIKATHQNKFIVYNIPNRQAIGLIQGRSSYLVCDTGVSNSLDVQNFYINPSHQYFGINGTILLATKPNKLQRFYFRNTRILIVNQPIRLSNQDNQITVDILVISGKPQVNFTDLLKAVSCKWVIFDSSTPEWKASQWKKACLQVGVSSHSVAEKGAFILNLN